MIKHDTATGIVHHLNKSLQWVGGFLVGRRSKAEDAIDSGIRVGSFTMEGRQAKVEAVCCDSDALWSQPF